MILDVFDKNFTRVYQISTYAYCQYIKELNSSGSFELRIALDDVALLIKNEGYFILFEEDTLGVITYRNPQTDSSTGKDELTIKGFLAQTLLSRRCIPLTSTFSGTRTQIVRQLVQENFISPSDDTRKMPIVLSSDPVYNPSSDTESISYQTTGGIVSTEIESLLDVKEMGHDLVPILTDIAIQGLEFRVIKGEDRTEDNNSGNDAVVFSRDLKNILESSYVYNLNNYKNVAYVAGEGNGTSRTLATVGDTAAEGFDRYELYVDARDLQSDNGETSLTPQEYQEVLETRGNSKLGENLAEESYNASIDSEITQFNYREDYNLGDVVTIKDGALDVTMNARVTKVQVTSIGEKSMVDVTFGYYKMSTNKKLQRNGVI